MTSGLRRCRKAAALGAAAFVWLGAQPAAAGDDDPVAPFMIGDGLYYVGASDAAAYLVSTDEGLILIDGGHQTVAPPVLANLTLLGFEPSQVKLMLTTDPRPDQAAGSTGGSKVTLGALTLTAHATPGCTAWSFPVRIDGATRQALLVCAPGADNDMMALAKAPCELFLANRLGAFKGAEKRAAMKPGAPNPFIDPEGCKTFFAAEKARSDAGAAVERATRAVESR